MSLPLLASEKQHDSFKYVKSLIKLFLAFPLPATSQVPANAEDEGSIPGLRRSPGEGNSNPPSILAWEIPWTEEHGIAKAGHDLTTKPAPQASPQILTFWVL